MSRVRPNGVPKISKKRRRNNLNDVQKLQDLIGTMWLYTDHYTVTQLTTEQKELFADVVELTADADEPSFYDRWWRR